MRDVLIIHQNFPGQFKHLAPALAAQGNRVVALTLRDIGLSEWKGIKIVRYATSRSTTRGIHPWLGDFETKVIRGEACFRAALQLKQQGYSPHVILAHPGWGESLFLKEVWPNAKLAIYCEFFYHSHGFDADFDPEFPNNDPSYSCRIQLKNSNILLHFQNADAALCPTKWQSSTFPTELRKNIKIIHDGVDTSIVKPFDQASITLNNKITLNRNYEIITFVNRNLEPLRGYHIFMRSLPSILHRRKNAHVLIVGGDKVSYGLKPEEGSWKEIFRREIWNELSSEERCRVHFLGKIDYKYFLILLQISTVHIYLTYPFILSWSLLEAMSSGCAVVGSDTGPVKEVIKNGVNGILVPFFDYEKLSATVCDLLDDNELMTKLRINARKHIIYNYDLKKICLPKQLKWFKSI